jgi:hypothetical protein
MVSVVTCEIYLSGECISFATLHSLVAIAILNPHFAHHNVHKGAVTL